MEMEGNVEIISKYMIKPSSPTCHHLKKLNLSFQDQIAPSCYISLIFFYQADELGINNIDRAHKFQLLKQSLSETLTLFYPLAGRIHDNSFVDCNDAGVELIETEVHAANVLDVIQDSYNTEKLKQYLPMEPYGEAVLLAVQINFFSCGGTAIGMCLSHKIADGTSLMTFINAWASICRGVSDQIVQPSFDLAQHFPPKGLSGTSSTRSKALTNEKIVTKRIIFDKEKVAALRREAVIGSQLIKTPTRVEAVSAYIWKHFMELEKGKMNNKKMFGALHIVNLRPRTSPPLSQHTFGNCWTPVIALFTADDSNNHEYEDLAKELGKVIREIDSDYIEQMQNDEYLINLSKLRNLVNIDQEVEVCNFSSWCRFSFYEVDYGWGKPVWVCTSSLPVKNLAILMSTKTGDGIEAWVNILEDDIDKFDVLG